MCPLRIDTRNFPVMRTETYGMGRRCGILRVAGIADQEGMRTIRAAGNHFTADQLAILRMQIKENTVAQRFYRLLCQACQITSNPSFCQYIMIISKRGRFFQKK